MGQNINEIVYISKHFFSFNSHEVRQITLLHLVEFDSSHDFVLGLSALRIHHYRPYTGLKFSQEKAYS